MLSQFWTRLQGMVTVRGIGGTWSGLRFKFVRLGSSHSFLKLARLVRSGISVKTNIIMVD